MRSKLLLEPDIPDAKRNVRLKNAVSACGPPNEGGPSPARLLTRFEATASVKCRFDTALPFKPRRARLFGVLCLRTPRAWDIFGGVMRSYIDIAAAVEVRKHTLKKIVTKAMHEVAFVAPVFVGDLVSFYTELVRIGRTSITIKVIVEADRVMNPGERARVTEAKSSMSRLTKTGAQSRFATKPDSGNREGATREQRHDYNSSAIAIYAGLVFPGGPSWLGGDGLFWKTVVSETNRFTRLRVQLSMAAKSRAE